jgi:hypothetical protein
LVIPQQAAGIDETFACVVPYQDTHRSPGIDETFARVVPYQDTHRSPVQPLLTQKKKHTNCTTFFLEKTPANFVWGNLLLGNNLAEKNLVMQ